MELVTYKIITLGLFGVGKTSLLLKATQENTSIPEPYKCTIGVDFKTKYYSFNRDSYKLYIWDTAGQERFYHINRLYYKDSQAVFLVFDVGNLESFEKITFFYYDFKANSDSNVAFVLIGNKIDRNTREVSTNDGNKLALKMGMPYIECSAVTGEGLDKIFEVVLREIESRKVTKKNLESFAVSIPNEKKNKPVSRCC